VFGIRVKNKTMKHLILVLTVFLVSVLGCKTAGMTDSSNAKHTSNSTEQPSKTADSKEALVSAFKKIRTVPFATVKTESTDSPTVIEQYSSATSSYSRKSADESLTETIIVGPETFSRNNSAFEWKKESGSDEPADKRFFSIYDYFAQKIPFFEVQSKGEETVAGKNSDVYELTLAKPNPDVPSLIRIWIGKETGLPMKMYKELNKDDKVTDTFDYESAVNIVRPTVGKK
jgi:hypothetical protein